VTDLIERLRNYAADYTSTYFDDELINSAADTIERQAAEIEQFIADRKELVTQLQEAEAELEQLRKAIKEYEHG
jgi:cell shape-determining protein MreC